MAAPTTGPDSFLTVISTAVLLSCIAMGTAALKQSSVKDRDAGTRSSDPRCFQKSTVPVA